MCATVNLNKQEKFLKNHNKNDIINVYKYVKPDYYGGIVELHSPFYPRKPYKPGIIKSDSTAKLQKINGKDINRGIHVLLSRQQAILQAEDGEIIIRLKAKISDLICVGYNDAVFSKVEFLKKDYEAAIKSV